MSCHRRASFGDRTFAIEYIGLHHTLIIYILHAGSHGTSLLMAAIRIQLDRRLLSPFPYAAHYSLPRPS